MDKNQKRMEMIQHFLDEDDRDEEEKERRKGAIQQKVEIMVKLRWQQEDLTEKLDEIDQLLQYSDLEQRAPDIEKDETGDRPIREKTNRVLEAQGELARRQQRSSEDGTTQSEEVKVKAHVMNPKWRVTPAQYAYIVRQVHVQIQRQRKRQEEFGTFHTMSSAMWQRSVRDGVRLKIALIKWTAKRRQKQKEEREDAQRAIEEKKARGEPITDEDLKALEPVGFSPDTWGVALPECKEKPSDSAVDDMLTFGTLPTYKFKEPRPRTRIITTGKDEKQKEVLQTKRKSRRAAKRENLKRAAQGLPPLERTFAGRPLGDGSKASSAGSVASDQPEEEKYPSPRSSSSDECEPSTLISSDTVESGDRGTGVPTAGPSQQVPEELKNGVETCLLEQWHKSGSPDDFEDWKLKQIRLDRAGVEHDNSAVSSSQISAVARMLNDCPPEAVEKRVGFDEPEPEDSLDFTVTSSENKDVVDIKEAGFVHWSKGRGNTDSWWKPLYEPFFSLVGKLSKEKQKELRKQPTREDMLNVLYSNGFTRGEIREADVSETDAFGKSYGTFWEVSLDTANIPWDMHHTKHPNIQVAYHSSAMSQCRQISRHGFRKGPSCTGGTLGVFCEGAHRCANTMTYMTHQRQPDGDPNPFHVWGVSYQLLVDRSCKLDSKKKHRGQWLQTENSISLKGLVIHGYNVLSSYDKVPHCLGWLRVWEDDLKFLAHHAKTL